MKYKVGDLVTWNDNIAPNSRTQYGIVIGFEEFLDWDLQEKKELAITIYWNGNITTKSSPATLKKL